MIKLPTVETIKVAVRTHAFATIKKLCHFSREPLGKDLWFFEKVLFS